MTGSCLKRISVEFIGCSTSEAAQKKPRCTMKVMILTEEGRPPFWIGGPSGCHQTDEGVSAGDVKGQAVQADLGTHPVQHAEHDLHGVGHL